MKAKKPILLAVLVVALLAVALILPTVATGKNDSKPTAWANWARSGEYPGLKVWTGEMWFFVELPLPWQALLAAHVQERANEAGEPCAEGHEVMNWQSEFDPVGTGTPPWKHNRTTDLVDWWFDDLGDGTYQARFLFRYDTEVLGWPQRYVDAGDVYHLWVLTDNPGNGMDHVDLYTNILFDTPHVGADPATWGAAWALDLDCRGVQVVVTDEYEPHFTDVAGPWVIDVDYMGSTYSHDMVIDTQLADGALSGYGGYPAGGPYSVTWTMTGSIDDKGDVTITLAYDGSGYEAALTGELVYYSAMGGAWESNASQEGGWSAARFVGP